MAPNIALPIRFVNRHSDIGIPDNAAMGKEVGTRLRFARKLRGMKQQELAKKAKVPQSSISEIETGETQSPTGTNLIAIAQTLQVSPDWLATGKGSMEAIEQPLPYEAVRFARLWLRLAPEVRVKVEEMVEQMVKISSADQDHVPDEKVAGAYGKPGHRRTKYLP